MAEGDIVIGVDLSKSHIRVGVLVDRVSGRYIVVQGTTDAKADTNEVPRRGELVGSFHDAHDIVSSFYGSKDIHASVIVVPNGTPAKNRDAIAFLGRPDSREKYIHVVEVISENTAVAIAYADRVKPNKTKTVAVVSTTGGILDVSVVQVKPKDLLRGVYEYSLQAEETHNEPINFKEIEREKIAREMVLGKIPIVGDFAKALPILSHALDSLKKILASSNLKDVSNVDVVAFVGNDPTPRVLKQAVEERFVDAKVWDDVDFDEVAAYGGAVEAFNKTKETA